MTMHLFGTILTARAVASNNRGEVSGTVASMQKVYRNGETHTTVSSEAIRYALRECWQSNSAVTLNRRVGRPSDDDKGSDSSWEDKEFTNPKRFLDDDVLGYMNANARQTRRGILEVGRAVSIDPWPGTISSQYATPGSNPIDKPHEKTKRYEPRPYACEVHDTRYQYTIAMTPDGLLADHHARTAATLRGLQNLRRAGGCHARFLFDFAPEAIVLRWTPDPAPRIMFCFDQDDRGRLSLKTLLNRVSGGDVTGDEVVVGTALDDIPELGDLKAEGVTVLPGVKAAVEAVLAKVEEHYRDRPTMVAEPAKPGKGKK